ncbi:Glycosyl transferase family 1 [Flavobacterium sp. 9AF]|uniref:glycosyltransferase family 4 protein n=1 Tax=Flavobacterium sp. 9AF TaxID=2653142 RepID=UPI0012F0814E|nr:glycosyltransferase family 4 protein [Flavobacterium sp. 9AF]VXC31894.1 Glycosyl transferase family 1 [Flavobacterium sp. 9AF]
MKSLLYIGNKLSKHGLNKTTIETLGKSLEEEDYIIFYASDKKNFFFRIMHMIFSVFKYYKKINFIIIDTYSTKAFWYALMVSQLARILRVKYIPILHGGDLPNRLKNNPYLCRLIFENAYANIAPSNYLKSEFESKGFTNLIHIPNAINLKWYHFKERNEFQPKLLWVRAFATIYNPVMAVEVFYEIKKKYPNAILTMVGPDKDGSLAVTKKRADELGVKVNFTGQLSKEDWWKLSESHDIFINTTHFDNTPVSVLEAMALGLPIVSTNVGGIPYLITQNKTGLLVNDSSISEMVLAIETIILDATRAKIITQEARVFVENLDWEQVREKWKSILH